MHDEHVTRSKLEEALVHLVVTKRAAANRGILLLPYAGPHIRVNDVCITHGSLGVVGDRDGAAGPSLCPLHDVVVGLVPRRAGEGEVYV